MPSPSGAPLNLLSDLSADLSELPRPQTGALQYTKWPLHNPMLLSEFNLSPGVKGFAPSICNPFLIMNTRSSFSLASLRQAALNPGTIRDAGMRRQMGDKWV